jgi:ABC-type bacteriocin/lantibiotic exporter with double-glycine peptidase domain
MTAAASGVGLLVPFFTKQLTGKVVIDQNMTQFILVSIYVVATATGLLLIKAIEGFVNSRITIKIGKSIQEATMARVLSLPPSFFKRYNTGELTARFASVSALASSILNGVFMTAVSVIMSLAYLFQLIGFAPVLVLPVVIILLVTSAFSILSSFFSVHSSVTVGLSKSGSDNIYR